jgi:DNA modification methylase
LRDYGEDGQIGLEKTPQEYIDRLMKVFSGIMRVLKRDGTLWVNISDSYAGSGKGAAVDPDNAAKWKQGTNHGMVGQKATTLCGYDMKPKELLMIPSRLAIALSDIGFYIRQDIIWAKPNPMPESVTDRCTKSHEYIFLLSKSARYYYDAAAIAEPVADSTIARLSQDINAQAGSSRVPGKTNGAMKAVAPRYGGDKYTAYPDTFYRTKSGNAYELREKRNCRSVWIIPTQARSEPHFASFPDEIPRRCIKAGSRKGDIVLDPFMGRGTTGCMAVEQEREFIGIDINPEYVELARKKITAVRVQESMFELQSGL